MVKEFLMSLVTISKIFSIPAIVFRCMPLINDSIGLVVVIVRVIIISPLFDISQDDFFLKMILHFETFFPNKLQLR